MVVYYMHVVQHFFDNIIIEYFAYKHCIISLPLFFKSLLQLITVRCAYMTSFDDFVSAAA